MTNPLITEARRLRAAVEAKSGTDSWYVTETQALYMFAVNHILAFADKIEELEREIAKLREEMAEIHASRNHLFETVKELRVRDANALTVIEQLRAALESK